MPTGTAKPPIFILGVPRSGTTLLRTILDSHSQIACGPETPWLGGHQPRSVMELWRFLREDPHGYAPSYGMPPEVVTAASRQFVDRLLSEYAISRGKARWAEKTPDNALYVEFLLELFPEARYVHLVRDGLDVALSTSVVEEHRRGISGFLERHLGLGPGVPALENNPFNALVKWRHWNRLIERALAGREHHRISYERLVTEPEATARSLTEFLGEPFEPTMLDYAKFPHEYPAWEWGSADVRARAHITRDRAGRSRRELTPDQQAVLVPLCRVGPAPLATAAMSLDSEDRLISLLADYLAGFARPLGLNSDPESLHAAARTWHLGLSGLDVSGARLLAIGPTTSCLPWLAALLGAEVVIADTAPADTTLNRLKDQLRISLSWASDNAAALRKPFGVAIVTSPAPISSDLVPIVRRTPHVVGFGDSHASMPHDIGRPAAGAPTPVVLPTSVAGATEVIPRS